MILLRMVLVFLLVCISLCSFTVSSEENYFEAFVKLSDMHQQWLQVTSLPDTAHLFRYPPYSYNMMLSKYGSVNITKILTLNDNTDFLPSLKFYKNQPNDKCSDDLVQIVLNIKSEWALKMLDSDGKLTSALLLGGVIWPGNYGECTSTYAPIDKNNHGDFSGRYCVASWTITLSQNSSKKVIPVTTGICVPDSCQGENIITAEKNIVHILNRLPVLKTMSSSLHLKSIICKSEAHGLDAATICYIAVISLFFLLAVLGSAVTVFDHLSQKYVTKVFSTTPAHNKKSVSSCDSSILPKHNTDITIDNAECKKSTEKLEISSENNSICVSTKVTLLEQKSTPNFLYKVRSCKHGLKTFLLCFSAFENGKKILNTEASSGQLLSLHGIRFLSLCWVIVGHTYISAVAMISNRLEVLQKIDTWSFQMMLQAPLSVDSFFLLSGFLLTYLFLKEVTIRNGKINWFYFYAHRLWRLTPVYMLVVGFYMLLFKYFGSGPFWDENYGDSCRHMWWQYLIYISNFIPVRDMCVGWSWYLANDMQFYIISPLFLYFLWKWPKVGLSIILMLLFGSLATTGLLSAKYDLIPMFVGVAKAKDIEEYQNKMWDTFDIIYDKPYCRIGPYLIGAFLGYILYKVQYRQNFLSLGQQIFGWIIATTLSLSVIFGLYHANPDRIIGILYNTLARSSFALSLSWVIFACETGHAGFIYKILSLKFWIPLSRLTYCAYLVHPILIHGYYQGLQTAFYFTQIAMVINFLGFLLAAFCLAFLVSFIFESPMMNLEKLFLSKFSKTTETSH